jgi:hypothetical protein
MNNIVYLVEDHDYEDYDVILVTVDKKKAIELAKATKSRCGCEVWEYTLEATGKSTKMVWPEW